MGSESKQIGDNYDDDAKFAASQGSGTDSELDSLGDISSDGGEYQDLPIIVESPQGEESGGLTE